jgi:hypothetical protein
MKNNQFFRVAGWCALVTALLMVGIHLVPSGTSSFLGSVVSIGTLLGLTIVFYSLYVAHRSQSAGLSLVGLISWVLAFGLNLISMVINIGTFLGYLGSLFWVLPFLIFGFLAYRSDRMPSGLAVVAFLSGISLLVAIVAGLMGNEAVVNIVSLVADIFMLVWLVWLGIVFLSGKFAAAIPAPAVS